MTGRAPRNRSKAACASGLAEPDTGAGMENGDDQDKPLSPALENYLAIMFRQEFSAGACRASDIATAAGVARSSVTNALQTLSQRGYIRYSPYHLINLTEKGLHAGQKIAHRNVVLRDFFRNILQLPDAVSAAVSCELEHVIPDDVMLRLRQFVLYMHHTEATWKDWQEQCQSLKQEHGNRHRVVAEDDAPPAIVLRRQFVNRIRGRKTSS